MAATWNELQQWQPLAAQMLAHSLAKHRVAHAYLFEGARGTGKKDMALFLAQGLFCLRPTEGIPCKTCDQCQRITSGNHPDVHVVEPDGLSIKKDQIRALQEEFSKSGVESKRKTYIINFADKMTSQAANSLLKFLEEPHPSTTAILLTEQMQLMLPTILSRCQHIPFQSLSPVLFKERLIEQEVHPTMAALLSKLTNQQEEAIRLSTDEWFVQARKIMLKLYEVQKVHPFEAMTRLQSEYLPHFKEKEQIEQSLDLFLHIYKDLLYIQTDKLDHLSYPDQLEVFQKDALQTSTKQLSDQLTTILEAKRKLHQNMNTQLLMEQLMLKLQGGSALV
ncbi:DNA polymerase III subunit delta' [Jeotgalibacillus proteolyticus]|uniref:DNA polymerase III subunit delta' n=1 Tax=Jeotgalibacillus proteolyticus TaxID=2082395 RepID=A0A2S5G6F7_9BACL|nr:DNA polymerase III subunit delta' [Jeotgalibacillus proteolyticus]PPA68511.1 DNA polymerase III subunit delta' [Jeotgalibacillus proteolyticus]